MKHLFVFLLLCSTGSYSQQLIDSHQREIVFASVNVVPMDTEQVLQNQTVVIKNGKIAAIGKNLKYSNTALLIDAKGKYLIPGLAEMHAHVPPNDNLEAHKEVLFLF
ncbi:MAG TPA: amidohydrolase, partial [Cyclobacteriaceae bacterium]|nr:amidohydrolase [Cyclobacteriaceae bacterium]